MITLTLPDLINNWLEEKHWIDFPNNWRVIIEPSKWISIGGGYSIPVWGLEEFQLARLRSSIDHWTKYALVEDDRIIFTGGIVLHAADPEFFTKLETFLKTVAV